MKKCLQKLNNNKNKLVFFIIRKRQLILSFVFQQKLLVISDLIDKISNKTPSAPFGLNFEFLNWIKKNFKNNQKKFQKIIKKIFFLSENRHYNVN